MDTNEKLTRGDRIFIPDHAYNAKKYAGLFVVIGVYKYDDRREDMIRLTRILKNGQPSKADSKMVILRLEDVRNVSDKLDDRIDINEDYPY